MSSTVTSVNKTLGWFWGPRYNFLLNCSLLWVELRGSITSTWTHRRAEIKNRKGFPCTKASHRQTDSPVCVCTQSPQLGSTYFLRRHWAASHFLSCGGQRSSCLKTAVLTSWLFPLQTPFSRVTNKPQSWRLLHVIPITSPAVFSLATWMLFVSSSCLETKRHLRKEYLK